MSADTFRKILLKNWPAKLPDTFAALGNASNGAMKVIGQYCMNIYVAVKDIKVTVLIVKLLNEDFIIRIMLIGANQLYWILESR